MLESNVDRILSEATRIMTRHHTRKLERTMFRLLVAVTYPLFLASTVLALPFGGVNGDGSVFTQALRRSEATIAIAFAG
jgi:hypothetical protein